MAQLLQKDGTRVVLSRDIDYVDYNPANMRTLPVPKGTWAPADLTYNEDLMKRLAANMKQLNSDDGTNYVHMWKHLAQDHQFFVELLQNDKLKEAFDHLNNLYQSPLMNGISQGVWDTVPIKADPEVAMFRLKRHWDTLLGICEYLGVIPMQNREQGFSPVVIPIDQLVEGMAQALSVTLPDLQGPSWQGGLWGLDTKRGVLSDRSISALYVALKISTKVSKDAKLVEIGGGCGYVVYWLYQLGFRDITLVDIPTVSTAQSFFLASVLGKENIKLAFETQDAPIKFMTPEQFNASDEMINLVYNTDSMPEMANEHLKQYLTTIARTAKSFLSINHECRSPFNGVPQNSVNFEVTTNFAGDIINLERNRYWLREGYAEEFYVTQHWE